MKAFSRNPLLHKAGNSGSQLEARGQRSLTIKNPKVILAMFGLLFAAMIYVHQKNFDGPTPLSRLDLLHALVLQGSLRIDAYRTNTPDTALYKGHHYSDKAPGTVALALPAFWFSAAILSASNTSLDSKQGWFVSSWVTCAGSLAMITAIGGCALFVWLCWYVSSWASLITTLALFLGAAPLPYATMLFSHSMVVGLLALSIWAIDGNLEKIQWQARFRFRDLLAGFSCGWALASEYTAGIVILGIAAWLISLSPRRIIAFGIGGALPLALIPMYSWACFGNPFLIGYRLSSSFPEMKDGLYSITSPNFNTAFNLLLSPTRGLFFWTPFLLMAVAGYYTLAACSSRLFWLTYITPLIHAVIISGRSFDWQAGPTLGPRYMAPILPFLALPCAVGVLRFPKVGVALAACSIGVTSLATLTDAAPNPGLRNPLVELHIPLFLNTEFSPNLGILSGLPGYLSVLLYYILLVGGIGWVWRLLPKDGYLQSTDPQNV